MDRLVYGLYKEREESLPWWQIVMPIESQLQNCGYKAVCGGHEYADSFTIGFNKTAQMLDWDYRTDIEEMITGLGFPATKKAMDLVHGSLEGGESPPIEALNKLMAYEQAKAIARTVMMNIYVKSALRKWDEDGITRVKRMEVRDKKTCPICKALNGKEYEITDLINLVFPLTNDSHPSCLLPGTLVSAGRRNRNVVGGFVAPYSGPVVEIVFGDGRRISATVNHMFLSPEGFVRAGSIRQGDQVLARSIGKRNIGVYPDEDGEPSLIEDVVGSLSEASGVPPISMPSSPEYLHGDGVFVDGNIDIIRADGELRSDSQAGLLDHLNELDFASALGTLRYLPGLSPIDKMLFAQALAADGGVSSLREFKATLLSDSIHSDRIGFGSGPPVNSSLFEPSEDSYLGNSEILRDLNRGLSGKVSLNSGVNIMNPSPGQSKLLRSSIDGLNTDAERIGYVVNAFPGLVAPLEVVKVNRYAFHGRVYDLQTESTLYWAEGLISSNCRGTFIPLISLDTYDPKVREIPLAVDFQAGVSRATNVPIEIRPWLRNFLKNLDVPMQVDFDPTMKEAYTWDAFDVSINPSALEDEDPREIVLRVIADQVWPEFEQDFTDEYIPLIKSGLAQPAKSFQNQKELFTNNYISWKMGQDPDAFSNAWWANIMG